MSKFEIPMWEKMTLTPEEVVAYSHIGVNCWINENIKLKDIDFTGYSEKSY